MTDVEWQLRNWLYFTWLCGDHIVEQHVHNLDVDNWAIATPPGHAPSAWAAARSAPAPEFGHIFDHFAIDYEYPNGVHVLSMCRQIDGCANNVSEARRRHARAAWTPRRGTTASPANSAWTFAARRTTSPYQQEHVALIASIRDGPADQRPARTWPRAR